MYFMGLATDYDGTVATNGRLDDVAAESLRRLKASGRKAILVTGRELDELKAVCPQLDLFDSVVAENGALLNDPARDEIQLLTEPPPADLVAFLQARGVAPLSVGRTILATWEPHQAAVLEGIRALGLAQEIIFNTGAVMVLPSGVNKATGLAVALAACGLSAHNVVAIGDAENDLAFLKACGCGIAVANALPSLKAAADLVTAGDHGAGVAELIDRVLAEDLRDVPVHRHCVPLVEGADRPLMASPRSVTVLAGTSGSGKSTMVNGFLERLRAAGYQFCVIDPEGDYEHFEGAIIIGDPQAAPNPARVLEALGRTDESVIVNLLGIGHGDRPGFFAGLLPDLLKLRAATARPHWLVIDEAHHMLPADARPPPDPIPSGFGGLLVITVHPDAMARPILALADTLIVAGKAPAQTLAQFCAATDRSPPAVDAGALAPGEVLLWRPAEGAPQSASVIPAQDEHRRHIRKYADGALADDESFYFRGPGDRLHLKAQNLTLFLQIADGVDDDTWLHHLRAGDYSRWFADAIKDAALAAETAAIEARDDLDARKSRALVAEAVLRRYTAPAQPASAQPATGQAAAGQPMPMHSGGS
jgi:hydroxymethylpyrimidine pyrophosphatase-like HAD family hydrolase